MMHLALLFIVGGLRHPRHKHASETELKRYHACDIHEMQTACNFPCVLWRTSTGQILVRSHNRTSGFWPDFHLSRCRVYRVSGLRSVQAFPIFL
jgi:hypothetical protein